MDARGDLEIDTAAQAPRLTTHSGGTEPAAPNR
ncbi:MAG: hypothetical protein ACJAZN_002900, partial [Planctomycetota bacterium]